MPLQHERSFPIAPNLHRELAINALPVIHQAMQQYREDHKVDETFGDTKVRISFEQTFLKFIETGEYPEGQIWTLALDLYIARLDPYFPDDMQIIFPTRREVE